MPDRSTASGRAPSARRHGGAFPPPGAGRPRAAWWPPTHLPSPLQQPAALRALRAVLVIPGLFALTFEGLGNLQIAVFATFGGFATLVMAQFGGTRRDKLVAHLGLAATGSVALTIGTAVNGITWLAVLVTVPVAFAIFFAGAAGRNAASGITAALLSYVLPVATAGTMSMVPDRLAGWWLASAAGTAAVLALSPPSPGHRLRAAAAASARTLAACLDSSMRGTATTADAEAYRDAKHELMNAFDATPYRPTGLATADQGLAAVVQLLEWCAGLVDDATREHPGLDQAAPADRELFAAAASVLGQAGRLLDDSGTDGAASRHDRADALVAAAAEMDRRREAAAAIDRPAAADGDLESAQARAGNAFHAQVISLAVRSIVADTMIASRLAGPDTIAARRRSWYGAPQDAAPRGRRGALADALGIITSNASMRSVWFVNSLRGSLALAAAVLVADVSGVQRAFWVVLGTLSVLRTNAASTGSTVARALAGTAAGFALGALLLLGIGTSQPALWAALPVAIAVAAYAPGALPFAAGQAAFTVMIVVLFNLLVPVGWRVGLLRIQDVALGAGVSLVIGLLFWPRGSAAVVGDDLADAFRIGAGYLTQAVGWALGTRHEPADAGPAAVTAGIRLDEALRGFLAEQGVKRVSKRDLAKLVLATTRLRLTAYSLAGLHSAGPAGDGDQQGAAPARAALAQATAELAGFYDRIATQVGRPFPGQVVLPVTVPALASLDGHGDGRGDGGEGPADLGRVISGCAVPHLLWVDEHLGHLRQHASDITGPAARVAEQRRLPWWR